MNIEENPETYSSDFWNPQVFQGHEPSECEEGKCFEEDFCKGNSVQTSSSYFFRRKVYS